MEFEDNEEEFDFDSIGYTEDIEEEDPFEKEYESIFDSDSDLDEDVNNFERDAVTGRKAKKSKMAALNKTELSKYEMDELFLEQ